MIIHVLQSLRAWIKGWLLSYTKHYLKNGFAWHERTHTLSKIWWICIMVICFCVNIHMLLLVRSDNIQTVYFFFPLLFYQEGKGILKTFSLKQVIFCTALSVCTFLNMILLLFNPVLEKGLPDCLISHCLAGRWRHLLLQ